MAKLSMRACQVAKLIGDAAAISNNKTSGLRQSRSDAIHEPFAVATGDCPQSNDVASPLLSDACASISSPYEVRQLNNGLSRQRLSFCAPVIVSYIYSTNRLRICRKILFFWKYRWRQLAFDGSLDHGNEPKFALARRGQCAPGRALLSQ